MSIIILGSLPSCRKTIECTDYNNTVICDKCSPTTSENFIDYWESNGYVCTSEVSINQ